MASQQEFAVLQRALSDPWPEGYDAEEADRDQEKPSYRRPDEVSSERMRRFVVEAHRPSASAQPTSS
jgi:hypothetical protein